MSGVQRRSIMVKKFFAMGCEIAAVLFFLFADVQAVPSFARETGLSCTACHTVWPQLNHFGRVFKMDGYVFTTKSASAPHATPVAGMVQLSYTSLNENNHILTNGAAPFDKPDRSATDRFDLPQQASVFYGGRIISHLGALAQLTYDGTANAVALDNTDIRYARTFAVGEKHLVVGATINNAPTVEDVWNTTPVWGFPFASSAIAPAPAPAALIDGTLGQQVGGLGAYASWGNLVYGTASVYRTTNDNITKPLGAGGGPDMITDGAVPYWRGALFHAWRKHSIELGTYGLFADVFPGGADSGPSDSFADYAFDAEYQFISNPHVCTLRTTWIHEKQDWDASFPLGGAGNSSDVLKTFRINAEYFYRSAYGAFGGCAGYFATTGDTDPVLYAPDPVDGSRTGSPESRGFTVQGTWVAKESYQFAVQYTIYSKFNGSETNYDGFGRNASDNDALYFVAWLMF
jgi:hypothetical protein